MKEKEELVLLSDIIKDEEIKTLYKPFVVVDGKKYYSLQVILKYFDVGCTPRTLQYKLYSTVEEIADKIIKISTAKNTRHYLKIETVEQLQELMSYFNSISCRSKKYYAPKSG